MLKGKTIVLGVCGGIAAYKAAALCSRLTQAGAQVHVILTESAAKFIAPLTFQTLSRHQVATDTFDEKDPSVVSHIDLADRADLVLVAPATANVLAKMALGLADDMLTTTLLATTAPVFAAPAMNVHMYAHPAVEHNMRLLEGRGVRFIEPGTGQLACGYVGKGRLAEPEEIAAAVEAYFRDAAAEQARLTAPGELSGKRVLVTAGGTVERIDPVRYLTNDSSGKMGYAIAEQALRMGAEVTLVTGKASVPAPSGVEVIRVESALDMLEAVMSRMEEQDIIVKAAAVADYRPAEQAAQKIKKSSGEMTLQLVKNPDILEQLGARKTRQFLIGFAAETHDVEQFALDKLKRKRCDLLVANDVTREGAGFGTDTNLIRIYDAAGLVEALPLVTKQEAAARLLRLAAGRLRQGKGDEADECTPKSL